MKRKLMLVLAIVACHGCGRGPAVTVAPPSEAAPVAEQVPAADPTRDASAEEEIFQTLTAHSWTGRPPNQPAFPPMDYSVASFRADGTWSFEFFTDYHIPAKAGKWNLQFLQGQWYLCQDDGGRGSVAVNDDGTITLGFGKFYPHEPLARSRARPQRSFQS